MWGAIFFAPLPKTVCLSTQSEKGGRGRLQYWHEEFLFSFTYLQKSLTHNRRRRRRRKKGKSFFLAATYCIIRSRVRSFVGHLPQESDEKIRLAGFSFFLADLHYHIFDRGKNRNIFSFDNCKQLNVFSVHLTGK